jgi:hypothetical protein
MPRTTLAAANDIGAPMPVEFPDEFDVDELFDVVDSVVRLLLLLFIME